MSKDNLEAVRQDANCEKLTGGSVVRPERRKEGGVLRGASFAIPPCQLVIRGIERCKLPNWGPGWISAAIRFSCILEAHNCLCCIELNFVEFYTDGPPNMN